MPRKKPAPIAAPAENPKLRRRRCGDRVLPANEAFQKTEFIPTAPQEFRFMTGAKAWA